MDEPCRSCGAPIGQLHEPFCAREVCPFCGDFITSCECIFEVLNLSDDERVVVEEYVDDEAEPLRSICAQWRQAVEAKGRIPY
jgi:hypothetical protein